MAFSHDRRSLGQDLFNSSDQWRLVFVGLNGKIEGISRDDESKMKKQRFSGVSGLWWPHHTEPLRLRSSAQSSKMENRLANQSKQPSKRMAHFLQEVWGHYATAIPFQYPRQHFNLRCTLERLQMYKIRRAPALKMNLHSHLSLESVPEMFNQADCTSHEEINIPLWLSRSHQGVVAAVFSSFHSYTPGSCQLWLRNTNCLCDTKETWGDQKVTVVPHL